MATIVNVLLNSATETGPGIAVDIESTQYRLHTAIVTAAGTNPVATVHIEISHNQAEWASAGTVSFTGPESKQVTFEAPVRHFRANLISLTGPQDGVVSATLSSG